MKSNLGLRRLDGDMALLEEEACEHHRDVESRRSAAESEGKRETTQHGAVV